MVHHCRVFSQHEEDEDAVWRRTHFERSVRMPTYLVCVVVCDFRFTENVIDRTGVPVGTFPSILRLYAFLSARNCMICTGGVLNSFTKMY